MSRLIEQTITGQSVFMITGKCSEFGGIGDRGLSNSEGLAIYTDSEAELAIGGGLCFYQADRRGAGLAQRLNPRAFYCAMRWDYGVTPRKTLQRAIVRVRAASGLVVWCHPCDWGPNERTERIIDLSRGALLALKIRTDAVVTAELFL